MDVEAPRIARACQPGEFVIVKMDEVGERIPLTICDYDREKGLVTIVFQIVGASTERMAGLKAGDSFADFVGPLGQPSEFVKIGLIVFFSWYWNKYQEKMNMPVMVGIAAILAVIPIGLIFAEPNLSTSLVVIVIILCMVYTAGISYRWIGGVLAVAIPAGALFIYLLTQGLIPFIHDYQARRILAWIYPHAEQYAENMYQQKNSIMAISSGQLQGKGLFNTTIASVKDGNWLGTTGETDFIFAIIGEELGFIGGVTVIVLFGLIVFECLRLAYKSRDMAGRLICTGMAALIGFQAFANIAVATQIFPNTGLPLPFISSGVSSLISIFIGMGLVLNVGLQRKIGNY